MRHLDLWLPDPQVRTRHERSAPVPPAALWAGAEAVDLDETRTLGRVVRWRIPELPERLSFRDLLRTDPFTVLDERPGAYSLSGLCGRIWTLRRDYAHLRDAEDFRAWDESGTVRVLLAHWVEPDGGDGAVLRSEARVRPVDRAAALRLRALWAVIGPFERLIGPEALELAVRRAEARPAYAGTGTSGRRSSASRMSDSENSGSSSLPDR